MILADSSAWIELFNATGGPLDLRLGDLILSGEACTTDVVLMEVLAGARNSRHRVELGETLYGVPYVPVRAPGDHLQAAELHRACRRGGETVRQLTDCLIAAVAVRESTPVLSGDADFKALARHTPLELA